MVAMLRSSEEMIQLQAAVAIRNLSFSPENEVRIATENRVPYANVCCRMLPNADVCCRMLTYGHRCG